MNRGKSILVLCNVILCALLSILAHYTKNDPYLLSIIFCLYYAFIVYSTFVICDKKAGLFLLFILTFGLFIGGRFFAILLGYNDSSLWEGTFFDTRPLPLETGMLAFYCVLIFLCFSLWGYSYGISKPFSLKNSWMGKYNDIDINKILNLLFYIFLVFVIFNRALTIKQVISEGYNSLFAKFQNQAHETPISALFYSVFIAFCGMAISYGNPTNKKKYFALFLLWMILTVICGSRGGLGGVFCAMIWIRGQNQKKNKIFKILIVCVIALCALLIISAFSLRKTYEFSIQDSLKILLTFMFDQGCTFIVFGESTAISYTWLHYFGSFVPGAGSIIKFFRGGDVWHHEFYFPNHLAYSLDPEIYLSGSGLGWSVLADLYLYAFKYIPLYVVLCCGWGYLFGRIEKGTQYNKFWLAFIISVSPYIFLLARGTSAVFPRLLLTFSICFFLCKLFRTKRGFAL